MTITAIAKATLDVNLQKTTLVVEINVRPKASLRSGVQTY